MGSDTGRRNFVAKEVLFQLLNENQSLAVRASASAGTIAQKSGQITEQEIRELLDPYVKARPGG